MRELKYRGLTDTQSPTWVYGCLVNNLWTYSEHSKYAKGTPCCDIIVSGEADDWQSVEDNELAVGVIPESVGEFTGLKDKNGTEIYEGDVVTGTLRYPVAERGKIETGVIAYSEREAKFRVVIGSEENGGFSGLQQYSGNIEVIGNIHQHPHLLTDNANA